jgi:hypothetical protein
MATAARALRTFLVECYAPGMTDQDAAAAAEQGRLAARELEAAGRAAVYIGAHLLRRDEILLHIVRCADMHGAQEMSLAANWRIERVVESTFIDAGEINLQEST